MDWILIAILVFLTICVALVVVTLVTLPKLGDERKNLVKMKAQAYTFTVVIVFVLIQIGENIYRITWGNGSYEGMNPLIFLLTISVVYLIALLFTKRKYGG